jgi:hypothetical protein
MSWESSSGTLLHSLENAPARVEKLLRLARLNIPALPTEIGLTGGPPQRLFVQTAWSLPDWIAGQAGVRFAIPAPE